MPPPAYTMAEPPILFCRSIFLGSSLLAVHRRGRIAQAPFVPLVLSPSQRSGRPLDGERKQKKNDGWITVTSRERRRAPGTHGELIHAPIAV